MREATQLEAIRLGLCGCIMGDCTVGLFFDIGNWIWHTNYQFHNTPLEWPVMLWAGLATWCYYSIVFQKEQMRTRSLPEMLEYEAKRRPDVANLLDRVHEMSVEELETVKVPLPWYRTALKQIRNQGIATAFGAYVNMCAEERLLADPEGYQCTYMGETTFVTVDRGGQIEIREGSLIFFPEKGGVWMDTLFSGKIDEPLKVCARQPLKTTLRNYKLNCAMKRCEQNPGEVPHTVVAGVTPPSTGSSMFSISKVPGYE